jgi:hypothetical protein
MALAENKRLVQAFYEAAIGAIWTSASVTWQKT